MTAAALPLAAQVPVPGTAAPPPRGQVAADCYARAEIWQGDVRTPLRLLFTRVAYNETASGGVRSELVSEWNKFVLPMLSGQGSLTGQNNIVYCQYADAAANTELARWPAYAAAPERVDWPGHSISGEPVRSAAAFNPMPQQPAALAQPQAASMPAAASVQTTSSNAATGPASAAPQPAQAVAPLAQAQDETAQAQQANAVYDEVKLRVEQYNRDQQARDDAYRQQVEAFQRQLAASQAAQRAFEEQQLKYEQDKAAYEAQIGGGKGK